MANSQFRDTLSLADWCQVGAIEAKGRGNLGGPSRGVANYPAADARARAVAGVGEIKRDILTRGPVEALENCP
jgi:hypothetical protein